MVGGDGFQRHLKSKIYGTWKMGWTNRVRGKALRTITVHNRLLDYSWLPLLIAIGVLGEES